MIDIHTHILPFLDDGSDSLDKSLEMIVNAINNGITNVFLTPHALRSDIKKYSLDELQENFNKFKNMVEVNYPIKLHLGQEIYIRDDLISALRMKNVITMNNSNYILLEMPYNIRPIDFEEIIHSCGVLNLNIILAHVERYSYLSVDDIDKLSQLGILMQVNSTSIIAKNKHINKKVDKLFKKNLVTFIASDIHSFREYTMKEAFEVAKKKYGEEKALDVFSNNARKIFDLN